MALLGIISVGSDVIDQLTIRLFSFVRYWNKIKHYISYSQTSRQPVIKLGNIVQYFHRVWSTHETSQAD
jgi:hypothetical protein